MEPPKKRRRVTAVTKTARRDSKPGFFVTPATKIIVAKAIKTTRVEHLEGRDHRVTAGTTQGASVLAMMQNGVRQAMVDYANLYVREHMQHLKI
jgi:hypothetical protein